MPTSSRPELLDAEQRARRRRRAEVRARLLGLVLDRDADAVVHLGDGAHALDREPPQLAVVGLERVVEAVLAGPQLDRRRAEPPGDVDALLAQLAARAGGRPDRGW